MKIYFIGHGYLGDAAKKALLDMQLELVDTIDDCDIFLSVCNTKRFTMEELSKARLAALNLHSGLLPKQRGYHPLNWAIILGERNYGLTLHKIAESIDSGDIVCQRSGVIYEDDTINDLQKRIVGFVPQLLRDFFLNPHQLLKNAKQQDQSNMTYAPRRFPSDSQLNLDATPLARYNLFRACDPDLYPCFVMENGRKRIVKEVNTYGDITYAD